MSEVRIICPMCSAAGLRSTASEMGSMGTLLSFRSFYDEEGRYHSHNPNVRNITLTCSNHHTWVVKHHYGTCWCGWSATPKSAVPPVEAP
jgi:hypothetical protein